MTGLISLLLLGTLILALGVRLLTQARPRNCPVTIEDYTNAREALESVFVEIATIKRILSAEDAEFISRSESSDVSTLFLKERKKLALLWFQETRKQIVRLMDLHLRLAAYTYDPNPGFELRLTLNYLAFVAVSGSASVLVWLLGPFKATRILSHTVSIAGNFCSIFSVRLERVNPARLGSGR